MTCDDIVATGALHHATTTKYNIEYVAKTSLFGIKSFCRFHGRRQRGVAEGVPLSLLPPAAPLASPPQKNYADEVLSGNHTHTKVWLIKRHFRKTTQISVMSCFVFKYWKPCKFAASIACLKTKRVLVSGQLHPFGSDRKLIAPLCLDPCPVLQL